MSRDAQIRITTTVFALVFAAIGLMLGHYAWPAHSAPVPARISVTCRIADDGGSLNASGCTASNAR